MMMVELLAHAGHSHGLLDGVLMSVLPALALTVVVVAVGLLAARSRASRTRSRR